MRPVSRREFLTVPPQEAPCWPGARPARSRRPTNSTSSSRAVKCSTRARSCARARRRHQERGDRGAGARNSRCAREAAAGREGQARAAGLVDMHAHVYPQVSALGLPADELVPYTATTTYVSAGDAGANTFSALKHYIVAQARSRIYAFVHISRSGFRDFRSARCSTSIMPTSIRRRDTRGKPGARARHQGARVGRRRRRERPEPLRRAILACERSGVRGARVMCHIGNAPGELSAAAGSPSSRRYPHARLLGAGNNTVRDGKVLAARSRRKSARTDRRRPRRRQLRLHGGRAAIAQGFTPDTIGSDIHALSGNTPGMPYLPWVMSKFLNLGFSLEQVVAMATATLRRSSEDWTSSARSRSARPPTSLSSSW